MSIKRVLVASVLVHLAVFAAFSRVRPPASAPLAVEAPDPIEVDWPPSEPETPSLPMPEPVAIVVAPRPHGPELPPSEAPAPVSSAEPPPDTTPYAANRTMIVFAPSVGIMGGASGARNPFLTNGADAGSAGAGDPARTVASADGMSVPLNKRAEQAVKDGLRARDQSIGLGLEGPVVHALEDATHSGFAPERGNATFVAVIDERGIVIDLKLLASNATGTDGARGWEAVRQNAVKSLATAKIDMRGVKRAELKIEVESKVLLASGNKPEDFPIKPVAKPSQTGVVLQTAAPGPANGALGGTVAEFDITDLHRKAGRVVHARLVLMTTR